MSNTGPALSDRSSSNFNGSTRRPSPVPIGGGVMVGVTGRPISLMDAPMHVNASQHPHIVQIVINKDENGYGMKVSGDNPVYVQSVKDGGAAEKAGLHAGDKIIKVNGVNVMQSTHTEVVALIKSSAQVVLTVQQRTGSSRNMGSPSLHSRPLTTHGSQRITGPQPVTHEKQYQLQLEREQQIRLMIEKEQRFIDQLRSEIAISPSEKKAEKLSKAESNLQKLHTILQNHVQMQNESPNQTHHRTKSSPESFSVISPAEASRRLIASESMNDLNRSEGWQPPETPPGTPPPPYPSPLLGQRQPFSNRSSGHEEGDLVFEESVIDGSSPDQGVSSSSSILEKVLANSSPIHAAVAQTAQQPIISMEDDEISDPEAGQLEDHGPFKSLSRLWEHTPHLAVFMNYVLSNSEPSSLLFYLITDLYKEGNAKEMRKWAFEIHSSFLVPGAPLRLNNVDENIAREIDNVLTREFDKEEILRKIFWKARNRAKEELTKQLADFQQKRTAGLGTIFGPNDSVLAEISQDKAKEMKLYESLLLDKLEPYLDELDRDNYDHKRYLTAAALTTVITRVFGVRPAGHALDRCPTFVNKEKSFRTKFIGRYSRKLTLQGHQFVAQPYYTVILCNHCHQIIYGIAPQGYQCSACLINLHRLCVKLYDDSCPGPINKKDRGIGKLMDRIHSRDYRRKPSSHFIQMEKERRLAEESGAGEFDFAGGEQKSGHPVTRTGSDRRSDAVKEESSSKAHHHPEAQDHHIDHEANPAHQDSTISLPVYTGNKKRSATNINRSESVKEQSEKRKQRRNISDPLHNTTHETVDLDQQGITYQTNSGSSSNSSLSSSRSSESPSTSLDAVSGFATSHPAGSGWDSDMEVEVDPPDWQSSVPEEELSNLHPHEKKRQDVINELFHTERSHLRNLRVLDYVFKRPLQSSKLLKQEDINLIFPSLSELQEIHSQLNAAMKAKRKEGPIVRHIGDMLLNMFDGPIGENFRLLAATFCERQQLALEFIKEKRKKDSRFDSFLSECEKNNLCRRLPLQGILPTEMQRLSKYPLLLERLIDCEEKSKPNNLEAALAELGKLKQAHDHSKEILNYVNEAAKIAFNRSRLEDIQRHLDTSLFEKTDHTIVNEFKNLDLTRYNLIHEGTMQLRRQGKQSVSLHVVLLEEAVILLQKDTERYVLKFFQVGTTSNHVPQPLAPIIKTSTLLVRANAASKSSLFLVNTSTQNSQMYDLVARDSSERDIWFKHISDAAEAYSRKEGKSKRSEPPPDIEETETLQDLQTEQISSENTSGENEAAIKNSDIADEEEEKRLMHSDGEIVGVTDASDGVILKVAVDEWPLVQPTEVHVAMPPVHTAEPVLTPIEQIRRKDEQVKQALADKEGLVADMLNIPRKDYQFIADIASEETHTKNICDREPSELVLAAIYQADQLLVAVNDSLNISDVDVILATGGKYPSCASTENLVRQHQNSHVPSVPVYRLQEIAATLSMQLTSLLSIVKQRDVERDRLRKEVQIMRELLHEQTALVDNREEIVEGSSEVMQSGDLQSIEESPKEAETN